MTTLGMKAVIIREDDQYIARCPQTGVTVRGDTAVDALAALEAAVAAQRTEERFVELVEFF